MIKKKIGKDYLLFRAKQVGTIDHNIIINWEIFLKHNQQVRTIDHNIINNWEKNLKHDQQRDQTQDFYISYTICHFTLLLSFNINKLKDKFYKTIYNNTKPRGKNWSHQNILKIPQNHVML
jgi:hypothetical protein